MVVVSRHSNFISTGTKHLYMFQRGIEYTLNIDFAIFDQYLDIDIVELRVQADAFMPTSNNNVNSHYIP